ncbi:30S ribosomal protein S17 [Raphidocelis subcapitata]|uniref:30S ribosomal protein S17 n=1 Tax=Raphidocelis subcapitata TaxID=307507 RepID=A0A2V0NPC0_9CHLO|nr:30S ribosomal protein S17 [Raphidocelis subcapitata]|eukprot:GBF89119.1 30S ribosomal protein S17 [Raphidocelis subcapitata]
MGGAQFIGRVVSNRMQKTVVVAVDYMAYLPKLKTYEKRTSKHFAHADGDHADLDIGDLVRIQWAQRMSKHKHYKVTEVLRKARVYSPEVGAAAAAAREGAAEGQRDAVAVAEAGAAAAAERLRALRELYGQRIAAGGGGSSGGGGAGAAAAEGGGGGDGAGSQGVSGGS